MLTKIFNALPLLERNTLVFGERKLIAIYEDNKSQKVFFFKLNDLKIDMIYDKVRNRLLDILAWENSYERVEFLKMST
jgi:hypothetical protein